MQETMREEKLEAVAGICRYDRKLVTALDALATELEAGREKLPSELAGIVMQGINWTVEVLNQVMDVLNGDRERVDKKLVNDALVAFNEAFTANAEEEMAEVIRSLLIPCLEQICSAGEELTGQR